MKKILNRVNDRIIRMLGGYTKASVRHIRESMIMGAIKDSRVIIAGFEGKPVKMMPDVRRINISLSLTDDLDLDGKFKEIAEDTVSRMMAKEIAENSYFERRKIKEYDGKNCEYHFMVYVLNPAQKLETK